jgi:hypothetical protein
MGLGSREFHTIQSETSASSNCATRPLSDATSAFLDHRLSGSLANECALEILAQGRFLVHPRRKFCWQLGFCGGTFSPRQRLRSLDLVPNANVAAIVAQRQ